MRRVGYLLGILLFSISVGSAALPPSAYEALQKAAPEALMLDILRVEIVPSSKSNEEIVRVTAAVLKVERSDSGVKIGDFLQFDYSVASNPDAKQSAGQIPILSEGSKTIAFLKITEGNTFFKPAAGIMSFNRF